MNMLLFHNSDDSLDYFEPFSPRPLFYWYSDRFCSHLGFYKCIYFFLINPKKDDIQLRSRTESQDFDGLHKNHLLYRDYCEGKLGQDEFAEAGIAMSFSGLKPTIKLVRFGAESEQFPKYVIAYPRRPELRQVVTLFDENNKPIPFSEVDGLKQLIPDINDTLPFKEIKTDAEGAYKCPDWKPMITKKNGTWL